jgi:hypothetical protein
MVNYNPEDLRKHVHCSEKLFSCCFYYFVDKSFGRIHRPTGIISKWNDWSSAASQCKIRNLRHKFATSVTFRDVTGILTHCCVTLLTTQPTAFILDHSLYSHLVFSSVQRSSLILNVFNQEITLGSGRRAFQLVHYMISHKSVLHAPQNLFSLICSLKCFLCFICTMCTEWTHIGLPYLSVCPSVHMIQLKNC